MDTLEQKFNKVYRKHMEAPSEELMDILNRIVENIKERREKEGRRLPEKYLMMNNIAIKRLEWYEEHRK